MKHTEVAKLRERAHKMLQKAGIVIMPEEKDNIEIADCGFDDIENCGLQIVVYENNDMYCAKELILFPRQMCPEHRHPPSKQKMSANRKHSVAVGERYIFM